MWEVWIWQEHRWNLLGEAADEAEARHLILTGGCNEPDIDIVSDAIHQQYRAYCLPKPEPKHKPGDNISL